MIAVQLIGVELDWAIKKRSSLEKSVPERGVA